MIPILYAADATAFTTNGIGRLPECLRCEVTEERNGVYECEFDLPITAKHYPDISEGMIVSLIHDDSKTRQPFVIYRRTAPIDGVVTFYAHHISYRLSGIVVAPFEAETVAEAFTAIPTYSLNTNPFTFWTDKSSRGAFGFKYPIGCRQMLGGVKGSILDAFGGGEYEFDKFEVKLRQHRGSQTGVQIRYGKNLADISKDYDISNTFGGIVGYWQGGEDDTVVRTSIIYASGFSDGDAVGVVDFSNEFDEQPTVAQLTQKATDYLQNEKPYEPELNITVDFVALWQTPEYEQLAVLQRVALCDYVSVIYPALGVEEIQSEVIRVVYDVLSERYLEIELGSVKSSFADVILTATQEEIEKARDNGLTARIQKDINDAISEATAAITGGAGGNFLIVYDANEKPIEVCWLDTGDIQTAVNVWRWNGAGLAHSSHGYNGPIDDFAILANGAINASKITTGSLTANLITAGTMLADRILGGTLKLGGTDNSYGRMRVYDQNGAEIASVDNFGYLFSDDYLTGALGRITYITSHPYTSYGIVVKGKGDDYNKNSPEFFVDFDNRNQTVGYPNGMRMFMDVRNGSGITADVWPFSGATDYTTPLVTDSIRFNQYGIGLVSGTNKLEFDKNSLRCEVEDFDSAYTNYLLDLTYNSTTGTGSYKIAGNDIQFQSSSSKRYKHDINRMIAPELSPKKLLDLPVRQFVYNDDSRLQYSDMKGQLLPGFIAEEVAEIYPAAVIRDDNGIIESWDERRIIPGMLALIQEQEKKIAKQEKRIQRLESTIEKLMGKVRRLESDF